jgi:hypothetical protein
MIRLLAPIAFTFESLRTTIGTSFCAVKASRNRKAASSSTNLPSHSTTARSPILPQAFGRVGRRRDAADPRTRNLARRCGLVAGRPVLVNINEGRRVHRILPLFGDRKPFQCAPVVGGNQYAGNFSPDGHVVLKISMPADGSFAGTRRATSSFDHREPLMKAELLDQLAVRLAPQLHK